MIGHKKHKGDFGQAASLLALGRKSACKQADYLVKAMSGLT